MTFQRTGDLKSPLSLVGEVVVGLVFFKLCKSQF
jgi:hypothetical protein